VTTDTLAPTTGGLGVGALDVARLDLRLRRRAILGYAFGLAIYTLAVVAIYPSFKGDKSLDKLVQSDPTMMAAFGVTGSLTSPVGWLNANIFNNFLPVVVVIMAIGYGAWCIAGQDESGTLAPIAALPLTRRNLVVQKGSALGVHLLPTVGLTFCCVLLGRFFQLDVGVGRLIAATLSIWLLGLGFGLLALLVGVGAGSRGLAMGVSSAIAAAAYVISSFASTISWIRPARFVSPFYWAVGADPLGNGLGAGNVVALVVLPVALLAAAVVAMRRADLH
jgi:beta-exotoxin I transport system permease protein